MHIYKCHAQCANERDISTYWKTFPDVIGIPCDAWLELSVLLISCSYTHIYVRNKEECIILSLIQISVDSHEQIIPVHVYSPAVTYLS